jgi:hypothetical protein
MSASRADPDPRDGALIVLKDTGIVRVERMHPLPVSLSPPPCDFLWRLLNLFGKYCLWSTNHRLGMVTLVVLIPSNPRVRGRS